MEFLYSVGVYNHVSISSSGHSLLNKIMCTVGYMPCMAYNMVIQDRKDGASDMETKKEPLSIISLPTKGENCAPIHGPGSPGVSLLS